jgi:FKBP-type peptidyl-prolyl cis-trans isomerase FkpA
MAALVAGCATAGTPPAQHPTVALPPTATADAPLTSEGERVIYALGLLIGRNLKSFELTPAEVALVERGLRDATAHRPAVDLATYGPKINALSKARRAAGVDREKARSQPYVAAAANEPGAEQLASGLVLRTLSPGTGARPSAAARVKVHYTGTLIDGSEFDSSYKRGEPSTFPLSGVIPCWTEALQKMKEGGSAKLVCPSDIAYGDGGRLPTIPGGATLTFHIELLEVVDDTQSRP